MSDVSVIIPTWNRAHTIEKAIRSALAQTDPPLEVLVCDDGSTDDTSEVIQSIRDAHLRWIPGKRSGCPAIPRNRGIRESKGKWLAFLDSDDEWLPEKLEKQVCVAQASGCRAVCSNAHRYIPGRGIDGNLLEWRSERITFADLLRINKVICSSTMVQKSLFPMVTGFPEDEYLKAWEDYALWLRIATQTDFAFIIEPLLIYRDDAANSIRNNKVDLWSRRKTVLRDFKNWGKRQKISAAYLCKVERQGWLDIVRAKLQDLRVEKVG